jgi:hypothetical protein
MVMLCYNTRQCLIGIGIFINTGKLNSFIEFCNFLDSYTVVSLAGVTDITPPHIRCRQSFRSSSFVLLLQALLQF